jgi:hypothetical protein
MVVLRRTQKLAAQLPASAEVLLSSDTALGDWYVNKIVIDRKPLLLLASAKSLIAILIPARNVRSLPSRLPDLVAQRLRRMKIPDKLIEAEVAAMAPVRVSKTADRSVVGILVDFAFMIPFHLERGAWDETTLPFVEAKLASNPCFASGPFKDVVVPDAATAALLASRWDTNH